MPMPPSSSLAISSVINRLIHQHKRTGLLGLIITLLCISECTPSLIAQDETRTVPSGTQLISSIFTNRRMGYSADASSVGWNPALLGMWSNQDELLLGWQHDRSYNRMDGFALFGRTGGLGAGWITKKTFDSLSPTQPALTLPYQLMLGYGFSVMRRLNLGVSLMYSPVNQSETISSDNIRFAVSGVYAPLDYITLSAGLSNLHRGDSKTFIATGSVMATPFLNFITFFANADFATSDGLLVDNFSSEVGMSTALGNPLVLSAMYNPIRQSMRLGVELNFNGIGVGQLVDLRQDQAYTGTTLLRFQEEQYTDAALRFADDYTGSSSTTRDAICRAGAYQWKHGIASLSGQEILAKMQFAGNEYAALYSQLQSISPNPDRLYAEIGKRYYGVIEQSASESGAGTTIIRSVNNHYIIPDSTYSSQGTTTVIYRVRDASNRNVGGLKKENFFLADSTKQITKFTQTASQKKVTADFMILMDCSGSMSDEIASVRTNVNNFSRSLANRNIDYRIGSILYKQDVTATLNPTNNLNEFSTFFSQAKADGYDEISSEAIMEATKISYRSDAEKIAILITDDCELQDNTDYTEKELINALWNKGIRLYGVINSNPTADRHNSGFTTRLTLGKEYDITKPFNTILDDISSEITTTYQLSYAEKPPIAKPIPPKVIVRGQVKSESGWNLSATIEAISGGANGSRQTLTTNVLNGEFELEAIQGKQLQLNVSADDHVPASATIAIPVATRNDTITRNFTLTQPKTILKGVVTDESKKPIPSTVKIEDATTLALIKEIQTNDVGAYSIEIPEGYLYRLTPSAKNYIATPADADMRTTKKGAVVNQDLLLTSINTAIEQGLTFKLKNIFFDTGKWDLRKESFEELDKLLSFLNEYQVVRIEIGAHTDNVGKDDANNLLSQRRAQSVVDYLKTKGVAETRMNAKGYGKSVPVATNDTPEGRQLNRRVEFKLVK